MKLGYQPPIFAYLLALTAVTLLIMPVWLSGVKAPLHYSIAPQDATGQVYLPLLQLNYDSQVALSIELGAQIIEKGIALDYGGDVDTQAVTVGNPQVQARRTGNGQVLPALDGNTIPDSYMQFKVDDSQLYAGQPTTRLRLVVEYLDQGTDGFVVQYDGQIGGPFGDGRFEPAMRLAKTNTNQFRQATFYLCDAYFANRDNGADVRIFDQGDGAETIRRVTLAFLPAGARTYSVDLLGANPWDSHPDSQAIQEAADQACPGDVVQFTSGENTAGYQGYLIDRTIFLLATTARKDLTFTSSDPQNHAMLRAMPDLRGFVVHLYAKSRLSEPGLIDEITFSHITVDGGRSVRICRGADDIENGLDDNWGSWLPECELGDPWCRPGGLAMEGAMDWSDPAQDYTLHPELWSTGIVVDDVTSLNAECGTALSLFAAASTIKNSVIASAGDHMHAPGCPLVDPDEGVGDWADGITFSGPNHTVTGNTITNPSDVGIVFFGGHDTLISNNTVQVTAGYNGAFAGIAVHSWIFGNVSGVQVTGNTVISEGDVDCGGMHAGINLGTHMWAAGCVDASNPAAVGNADACQAEPAQPAGALCPAQGLCQVWTHIPAGGSLTLADNHVSGAQINYLVEGLDQVGTLNISGNTSFTPRQTDWESADIGCDRDGQLDTWGTYEWAAHHPSLPGWVDQRVHCER